MRPVRFVALTDDGHALVLRDEAGRMLSLAIDDVVTAAVRREQTGGRGQLAMDIELGSALSPRDIQARIRAGESAEDVARAANAPAEKVLRFAGPVLQERAAVATTARRTRLRTSETGASLAEVVDARLFSHGVDPERAVWDGYRTDGGTWRVLATWPSGRATARATWELDRARSVVSPVDEMAQFLSNERPTELLGHDEPPGPDPGGPGPGPGGPGGASPRGEVDTEEIPVVPPVAVLRPRGQQGEPGQSRNPRQVQLPSWDDILFGTRPRS